MGKRQGRVKYNDCLPKGMRNKGRLINLSNMPLNLPKTLTDFKKIVVMPDYSPNHGLPTGVVAIFDKEKHDKKGGINPEYLGNDVGCGMLLAKFDLELVDLEDITNQIASRLMGIRKGMGSLGGGNHFVTFYQVSESSVDSLQFNDWVVLIHSGSRNMGRRHYQTKSIGSNYLEEQQAVIEYAKNNRKKLLYIVEEICSQDSKLLVDRVHNFIEVSNSEVIYRKGAVKVESGDLTVIPSSMSGYATLVMANENIGTLEYSLPHATGRRISRRDAKQHSYFLDGFPSGIYVPYFISPEGLNEELPENYRKLDEILGKIAGYVSIKATFIPKSTIML
ncbi:MAG: RtcB family protein [Candidatus Woesearchaeota archaeon]